MSDTLILLLLVPVFKFKFPAKWVSDEVKPLEYPAPASLLVNGLLARVAVVEAT